MLLGMKERSSRGLDLRLIGLSVLFSALCFAQRDSVDGFRWDWRKAQELDWNQTIKKSKLPASEKEALIATIKGQLQSDSDSADAEGEESPHLEQTEIKMVQLHGHGSPEVIVQATGPVLCSPTGNCSVWVLKREHTGYRVILDGNAQTFTIQPTVTNGFHDIVLGIHGSAFEAQLTLYRFDGEAYRDAACYWATWEILDKNGESKHLKEPRVTRCGEK